jgi:Reverse transcriptase (RNA-dependent DNA polymerase)
LRTHKFGIKIPKTVREALQIDAENGDTQWRDAIEKEMKNIRPAFRIWDNSIDKIPNHYQKINCHMIFDVKMSENFRRKARFVAGGHTTEAPSTLTYSSVVSRDSVRIALMVAALNDLEVTSCDIQNAYLTAECREKIWFIAGPEFGDEEGQPMIVEKALYGLKTSGAAFRALLADTLYDSGFRPTRGDPDVHIRPAVKSNGFQYYEMILCYVDDVICISHRATDVMKEVVQKKFKLKNDAIESPEMYLGAQLTKREITGCMCWTMTSNKYVEAIVKNLEVRLKGKHQQLPTKCDTPVKSGYRPELDATDELKADHITMYQELIGELRWAVELGRIDILLEVSLLSSHLANPRLGHLEQAIHIFGYLKKVPRKTIAMDPRVPLIDERRFVQHDWHDFYRGAKEPIPEDIPKPRGNTVSIHCFVDASHADNRINRRSQTGILLFMNRAPIIWYSKRQNTVESSTFGSEFVALKIATELIQGLRYKLRTFGIPIDGPSDVYCDNEAVTKACINPDVTLAKKHNAVAYHKCREAVAMRMIRVAYEPTGTNLSDLLTKFKTRTDRERLIDAFMY